MLLLKEVITAASNNNNVTMWKHWAKQHLPWRNGWDSKRYSADRIAFIKTPDQRLCYWAADQVAFHYLQTGTFFLEYFILGIIQNGIAWKIFLLPLCVDTAVITSELKKTEAIAAGKQSTDFVLKKRPIGITRARRKARIEYLSAGWL